MREFKYYKVDAFTSGKSLGNPAAFIDTGNIELTSEEMLKIGKEHKGFVSEIVFCNKSYKADVKLIYYSSECEVSFCGHGTIATIYELIINKNELMEKEEIIIETNKKGLLKVYNKMPNENAVFITAPKPVWNKVPVSIKDIALALKINEKEISLELPLDFIDAGLRTLIVPIEKYEKEISIYPEQEELRLFCIKNEIDIILIFTKETSKKEYIAHTRVFAPKFGYLEDPATGSGNSAFGYYMLKNKMWNGGMVSIEQGGENIVFNEIKLTTNNGEVLFGGKATKRIEGMYFLE